MNICYNFGIDFINLLNFKYMSFQLLRSAATNTAKFIKENKLQKVVLQNLNIQLAANSTLEILPKLNGVFSKHKVDTTHLKNQLKDLLKRQQAIPVSIKNISDSKLIDFITDLKKIDVQATLGQVTQVPQFPTLKNHIDLLQTQLIPLDGQGGMDSPQFTDLAYRKRRDQIAQIAMNFKMGDKIPYINYTDQQNDLWVRIFEKLRFYHKGTMCSKFEQKMETLNKHFKMYQKMPQLEDLSMYLKSKSGFTIKPAHGIINQRAFFNALAFKVFNCTQYLRHSSTMFYTPEPDIVHEIVGHVPMFADPAVAVIKYFIFRNFLKKQVQFPQEHPMRILLSQEHFIYILFNSEYTNKLMEKIRHLELELLEVYPKFKILIAKMLDLSHLSLILIVISLAHYQIFRMFIELQDHFQKPAKIYSSTEIHSQVLLKLPLTKSPNKFSTKSTLWL